MNAENPTIPKLQSVVKSLHLLKLFTSQSRWRMRDIVQALGYHKSSVQRLLNTLEAEKFIEKVPENPRDYRLGVEALILGIAAQESLGLKKISKPFLQELVDRTRETAHMGVREGFEVYYLEKIDSPQELRMVTRIGQRVPLHTSSMGKSMLAFLPAEEVDAGIDQYGLIARTKNSITSRLRLDEELRRVREEGVAFDNEEWLEGVRCIGAPVRDSVGSVIAAVSISAPAQRITEKKLPALIAAVKDTARKISNRLGFSGGPDERGRQGDVNGK